MMKSLFLILLLGLNGCLLREPSPFQELHPKARLYIDKASEASFSPNGQWVAFVMQQDATEWSADLYVRDLKSGQDRRLTVNRDYDGQPRWAPNSKLLLFTARREGRLNLFLIAPEDGSERQLTWDGGRQGDFAPDGQSIVYSSDDLGSPDLFLTSPHGAISRRLTSGKGREWFPRYSPDGRWIVYVSDQAGSDDLWLMDRQTSQHRALTSLAGQEIQPCWSPDSQWIVFIHDAGPSSAGKLRLFAISLQPDAQPFALTQCEGLACESLFPTFTPDGQKIIFSASSNPMQMQLLEFPVLEMLRKQKL